MTPRNSSFGLLGKRSGHFFKSKRDNLKDSESLATSADDATEEEEYDMANAEVEHILGTTKPKHIAEGLQSGLGYILRGAVGAAGVMVLMPTVAGAEGKKEAGIIGGIAGGASGIVAGVVQGANVLGGGVVTGVSQIVCGAAATPNAVIAPLRGYWWNGATGRWEQTFLLEEERWIKGEPIYDEDILGIMALPEELRRESSCSKVKDMYYYDKLGLDPDVDSSVIKRRYFNIARKFSPDRSGANPEAQTEFKEIGRAYTVLMNPELRAKYDLVGRDGLWDEDDDDEPDVDPMMLYTLLFGSEKFNDYIGKLAAVSSARIGPEVSSTLNMSKSRLLQKRRVTRLALVLAERLQKWAEDGTPDIAKKDWEEQARFLCDASYGIELVRVIGKIYTFSAVHFLGSLESGIGMPSISRWAKKQNEALKVCTNTIIEKTIKVGGNKDNRDLHAHVSIAIDKSAGDEELEELAMDALKNSNLKKKALDLLWQETVVDITSTVKEAAQMVLNDQNITPDVRKARAQGLEMFGVIFENCEKAGDLISTDQKELEKVAFHAMLDTVWRQEVAEKRK
mmetsp:Transcript_22268/g.24807  ORF Transcript_22268/g.24807 Transcript_22268/m.24807 type:complete len:566 (+) Transcript_22268:39-1736(+)